jgi:protein-disulfide isomerase
MNKKTALMASIGAVFLVSVLAIAPTAHAASLTGPQVQAVLGLLQAFNIPQATIDSVDAILHGGSAATHVRGPASAKVTVVEYCDTESPFCKVFHATMRDIYDAYQGSGDVAWEYRSFPLSKLYSNTDKEAQALECAAKLGGNAAFWRYIDDLYDTTPSENGLDPAELAGLAKRVGLPLATFNACTSSGAMAARVSAQYQEGLAAGVRGTPTSILLKAGSSKTLAGAQTYATVKAAIDALIK